MKNEKKVLGVGIDGVIRDLFTQFDKIYRKKFIKNDSLVGADENFQFVKLEDTSEEEETKIQKLTNEKIYLPINTFDLFNHYFFEDRETFERFFYEEYSFQIFGAAPAFLRSIDSVNRLQKFGEVNNFYDTILLSKESDKAISSTYHFLAKIGCRIKNIKFVNDYIDKWDCCDVLIDASPFVFDLKPKDKISIKINQEYNVNSDSDYSFDSISETCNNEFLLKIFNE